MGMPYREFDIDSDEGRENSLHELDTLVAALGAFREAFTAEFEPYDRRAREPTGLEG
jgi:hypothetical protein